MRFFNLSEINAFHKAHEAYCKASNTVNPDCPICTGVPMSSTSMLTGPKVSETPETIYKWQIDTFGKAQVFDVAARMEEEAVELVEAIAIGKSQAKIWLEIADVYIVLCGVAGVMSEGLPVNILLQDAIDKKMAINRARKWSLNGDGTAQHIEEAREGDPVGQ